MSMDKLRGSKTSPTRAPNSKSRDDPNRPTDLFTMVVLSLEGGSDPEHPIGGPGSFVDVGDQAHEDEPVDLAVTRRVKLDPTGHPF
jgi:hypothetical protein